jgi:hypothetical protein
MGWKKYRNSWHERSCANLLRRSETLWKQWSLLGFKQ